MKVLFDFGFKEGVKDGMGVYGTNLVTALQKVVPQVEATIHPEPHWKRCLSWPPFGLRKLTYLGWNNFFLPKIINNEKPSILHGINLVVPLRKKSLDCKTVVTIYDLTYVRFPETLSPQFRLYYEKMIPRVVQRADHILAISEFTRQELMTVLQVPEHKITVTYLASKFSDRGDLTGVQDGAFQSNLRRLGLKRPFILSIGTIEPRKNLVRLIHAFKLMVDQKDYEVDLVIVGAKGWMTDAVFQKIIDNSLHSRVKFLGHVSDNDLFDLYKTATLLAYPSLYEGFGLPVLEAMTLGTPVITSNVSSLPEIAGDAALTVNPFDVDEIAHTLQRVLNDSNLQKSMSVKGLKRAKHFSWEKTAFDTLKAYENALKK